MALPAHADAAKEADCGHQADVVAAVQAARVAGVAEAAVAQQVSGSVLGWPEKYDAVVPLVTPWVYSLAAEELGTTDLAVAWKDLCLQQ